MTVLVTAAAGATTAICAGLEVALYLDDARPLSAGLAVTMALLCLLNIAILHASMTREGK